MTTSPEWRLQHAIVKRFKLLQKAGYVFDFAGDMNAAKRGPQAATIAKATGLQPGEPDVRVYLPTARLKMIELKTEKGELSEDQEARHATLQGLGFEIVTLYAANENESADLAESLVEGWLIERRVA